MLGVLVGTSRVLGGILTAVEFIASVGYLHRDITPENILVSEDGEGVLADFGLCIKKESAILPANIGVGNVGYSAMEVATAGSGLCSDLFSISVCFLESMLGRNPFDGKVCEIQEGKAGCDIVDVTACTGWNLTSTTFRCSLVGAKQLAW